MSTTIQVGEDTLRRLKERKDAQGAASYDEVLQRLLARSRAEGSLLGAHPSMTSFAHERTGHDD